MKLILSLLVGFAFIATASVAQNSMASGFTFNLEKSPAKHAVKRVIFPDGTKAERFELRSGDCNRRSGDCKNDRERVEFLEKGKQQNIGQEVWVGWSVFVPADFPLQGNRMNVKLGQFHQLGGNGPRLLFQLDDANFTVELRNPFKEDSDPMRPVGDFKSARLSSKNAILGKWVRVVVHSKWSLGNDGFVNVWLNGTKKFSYSGPSAHNSGKVYFRYGLYRSFVSRCGGSCPTLVAYYKDVKRGKNLKSVQ